MVPLAASSAAVPQRCPVVCWYDGGGRHRVNAMAIEALGRARTQGVDPDGMEEFATAHAATAGATGWETGAPAAPFNVANALPRHRLHQRPAPHAGHAGVRRTPHRRPAPRRRDAARAPPAVRLPKPRPTTGPHPSAGTGLAGDAPGSRSASAGGVAVGCAAQGARHRPHFAGRPDGGVSVAGVSWRNSPAPLAHCSCRVASKPGREGGKDSTRAWGAMVRETVFRSEDVPAADRFDYWRELMIQTLAPLDMSSDHADDFQASMKLLEFGAVHVSPQTFQSMRFHRTPELIRRSDPGLFHMSLVTRGTVGIVQRGQETTYNPGDLCVVGSSRPFDCLAASGRRAVETVAVAFPTEMLASAGNAVDKLIGHPVSGREGFGALLAQFLTRITTDTGSFTSCDGPRLGVILLDLLSGLLAHVLEAEKLLTPESHRRTLVLRIRAFVRSHLHDPQPTPRSIAAAHNISTSYLHRLFQHEEETIAAWIRHQRLDHTRRDLADPALRTTPIHVIAARWGFPRAADFTRAFRAAYGMPPSDHRHHADAPVRVDSSPKPIEDPSLVPGAVRRPAAMPFRDRLPGPVAFRQVTPRDTGADPEQDPVDHPAMVAPPASPTARRGQMRFE
ncbi:hypothetical protein GCM10010300_80730 [Streptomyces olivaceoviridis]|nr:hypothetical protein GCM10010300_80730 [Streptomyces olivaceoviridis]